MSRDIYTRCPNCQTVFRVTEQHLELAKGKVRCGACMSIFQGTEHLVKPKNSSDKMDSGHTDNSASAMTDSAAGQIASPGLPNSTQSSFDKLANFQPELNVTDKGHLMHAPAQAELDIHRSSQNAAEKTEFPIDSFAQTNESANSRSDALEETDECEESLPQETVELAPESAGLDTYETPVSFAHKEPEDELLFDDDHGLDNHLVGIDNNVPDEETVENSLVDLLKKDNFPPGFDQNNSNVKSEDSPAVNGQVQKTQELMPEFDDTQKQDTSSHSTDSSPDNFEASETLANTTDEAVNFVPDTPISDEKIDDFLDELDQIFDEPNAAATHSYGETESLPEENIKALEDEFNDDPNTSDYHLESTSISGKSSGNSAPTEDFPTSDFNLEESSIVDDASMSQDSIEEPLDSLPGGPRDPLYEESLEEFSVATSTTNEDDELDQQDYDPFDDQNIEKALFQQTPDDYHTGELSMDQLSHSLKDEDFDPDPLDEFDEMVYQKSHRIKWFALSGILIALSGWGSYILWSDRQQLAWDDTWGDTIHTMCSLLPCNIQPRRNVDAIELLQRTVQPDEESEEFSEFSLILRNNAPFTQPYPAIEIHFTDTNGQSVARQTFYAKDYLGADSQQTEMPSGQRVYVLIKAKNPSADAFGFEFTFK